MKKSVFWSIIKLFVILNIALCGFYYFAEPILVESKGELLRHEPIIGASESDERGILEQVNKERRKYRLGSLKWNSDLAELARNYSKKMARENFFSHYDSSGNSVADRAKSMKINKWTLIGENLFMCRGCQNFPQVAVKGWMRSTGHRENILEDRFNQTGIGIAKSSNGTIYVTQVFIES